MKAQPGTEENRESRIWQAAGEVIRHQGAAARVYPHHQRVLHRVQVGQHVLSGGGGPVVRQQEGDSLPLHPSAWL